MPIEFKIPELGENVTAGDVVRVLVKAGDTLAKDQPVLELETDKATIEVPVDVEGTVKDIKVKTGGQGQGRSGGADGERRRCGAAASSRRKRGGGRRKPEEQPERQEEKRREPKADSRPAPPEEGGAEPKAVPEDEIVEAKTRRPDEPKQKRGEVVDISRGARPQAPCGGQPRAEGTASSPPPPAAPSVRRMARELGVDIRSVTGSGEGGRISVDDVHEFVRGAMSGSFDIVGRSGVGAAAAQPLPDFTKWGPVERQADEQYPPEDGRTPRSRLERDPARHPA